MLKHQLLHPKINEVLGRAGHHASILIADDNEANGALLSEILEEVGYRTICVRTGAEALLKVTNGDEAPAEFESHDLKVEKIVVPGGTVTVTAGPLKPGTYQFFDDYHPDDAKGTVTAKE